MRLWTTARGVVAELADGGLSALGADRDEALERLAAAVELDELSEEGPR